MIGPRRIKEEVIRVKTGKSSTDWYKILDKFNSPPKGHTAMARYLREKHNVSPWWAQIVTNRYEWERGLRTK